MADDRPTRENDVVRPARVYAAPDLIAQDVVDGPQRCGVMADDGMNCHRLAHLEDPDAHDFAGPGPMVRTMVSVDGGRRWSDWIHIVNAVRGLILTETDDRGRRYGVIRDQPVGTLTHQLERIAGAVGLKVTDGEWRMP